MSRFTLSTAPKTDFWRKPPSTDSANAPTQLVTVDSRTFHRVRVTVAARWERLYDQGGLFVVFPAPANAQQDDSVAARFWLKAGIEFYHGRPFLSVVASREWSDWSLTALPDSVLHASEPSVTIELVREVIDAAAGTGSSLFVYVVHGGTRDEVPVREVTWAFEHEGKMELGTYAARPTAVGDGDGEQLQVHFEGFEHE